MNSLADIQSDVERILATFPFNDINTSRYGISQKCRNLENIPPGFVNLLLQDQPADAAEHEERGYVIWNQRAENSRVKDYMIQNFPQAFRTRISVLPAKSEFCWHIDTNTSVACRFYVPVTNPDAYLQFKRNGKIETAQFQLGSVNFINAGYPHRVVNPTDQPRTVIVFSIHYPHIQDLVPLLQ